MSMPTIPADKISELVVRHNNGESYRQLAKEFNISHTTIMRYVKKHKTPPESPHTFHGLSVTTKQDSAATLISATIGSRKARKFKSSTSISPKTPRW